MKIVVIDNYDSFTYNLVQLVHQSSKNGANIKVFRNDEAHPGFLEGENPSKIIISPGPKNPSHAGFCRAIIEHFCEKTPILGVCLGHQIIAEMFGGSTVRAPIPVHGHTSSILHDNSTLFKGIPSPFSAARYHSLLVDTQQLAQEVTITARTEDNLPMALAHSRLPLFGVQFHPESFLTEHGAKLMNNFLETIL